jgi:hypothetical protein
MMRLLHGALISLVVLSGLNVGSASSGQTQNLKQLVLPPPYIPGLGEIMASNVQPHHIKLGLAGQLQNWPLASYELDELKEAFETARIYQATWNNKPIAQMQADFMEGHLSATGNAIKEKDIKKFIKAYTELNAGCNACHQAAGRAFIVIQAPKTSPFPNQDFKPIKSS